MPPSSDTDSVPHQPPLRCTRPPTYKPSTPSPVGDGQGVGSGYIPCSNRQGLHSTQTPFGQVTEMPRCRQFPPGVQDGPEPDHARQCGAWGRAARWHGSALHRLTRWHGVVNRHLTRWGAASAPHPGARLTCSPEAGTSSPERAASSGTCSVLSGQSARRRAGGVLQTETDACNFAPARRRAGGVPLGLTSADFSADARRRAGGVPLELSNHSHLQFGSSPRRLRGNGRGAIRDATPRPGRLLTSEDWSPWYSPEKGRT